MHIKSVRHTAPLIIISNSAYFLLKIIIVRTLYKRKSIGLFKADNKKNYKWLSIRADDSCVSTHEKTARKSCAQLFYHNQPCANKTGTWFACACL